MKNLKIIQINIFLTVGLLFTISANAAIFEYSLSNKGSGAEAPPDYGLRLDNLFGTGGGTHWTFSFEQTDVRMVIDSNALTAHVFGEVIGGIDDDRTHWIKGDAGAYSWDLDFTFTGITIDDFTTGFWTAGNNSGIDLSSTGTLTLNTAVDLDGAAGTDEGRSIGLADYASGTPGSFFNHSSKGPYVSSWLADTTFFTDDPNNPGLNRQGACCKDFGYRATRIVPEPSAILLMSTALIGIGFARRFRNK